MLKHLPTIALILTTVATGTSLSGSSYAAAIIPISLKCELRTSPTNVDTTAPRLGWQIAANDTAARGIAQSAYQILVASSRDLLTPEKADMWNSGRRESSETLQIVYEGEMLKSNRQVFWTVRSWDQNGEPSSWAEPAQWSTAHVSPGEWRGQWIGTEIPREAKKQAIESAQWIWSPESQDAKDEGTTSGKPAGNAVRYFRTKFTLPEITPVDSAQLLISADNEAEVFLNGQRIGEHNEWQELKTFSVGSVIKPSAENLLNIRVKNTGSVANSAGLAAVLVFPRNNGEEVLVPTDARWEVSRAPDTDGWPRDWASKTKEDPQWEPVRVLGKWGMTPWHKVRRGDHPVLPVFRKEFALEMPVRRAVTHISGLGHYILSVNGTRIGDHYLDPAWSWYENTVYYNTFDVTEAVNSGANAMGVMLGKGFYNTQGDRRIHGSFTEHPLALTLQTDIEYEDGSTTKIVSDATWKWTSGPLTHNSILGGSSYDARLVQEGWDQAGFDDSSWKPAVLTAEPGGKLKAAFAPPMRTKEEFKPVSIDEPKPGQYVYDFGQNASATPRVKVRGPAGTTIKLIWGEQREGGDLHVNNGKGVVSQSGIGHGYVEYTLRGDEAGEEWFSDLFYTGFQYLELNGGVPDGRPNPENLPVVTDITSVHVRTDQPIAGTFATSNEMYNRIDKVIDWAVKSNLGHVFTDCPTREKLGWLEVPWLMWASTASRYDINAYAEKIAGDIRDSQLPDGQILTVAPRYPTFTGGFHYTAEWGAAGVFLPWYTYEWYNDRRVLEENFEMMRGFVEYMKETSDKLIAAPGLGDWYDYGHGESLGASRFTPSELTATIVFAGCADVVSSTAAVLKRPEDQQKYAKLAADIRTAFNKRYRTGPGQYENNGSPQTAHAMALVFDMVPEGERDTAAQAIVEDLEARSWQQTSGDVGYRFLLNALAQTGHSDAIFKILNREEMGSYAFIVNAGWTSMPEAWNASTKSSMNHCMLGHIQEWFTQHLVGIAPAPGSLGFDKIVVQPTPGDGVTSASGTLDSPRGKIAVSWEQVAPSSQDSNRFDCQVVVPPNTTAFVKLPVPADAEIREGGKPIDSADKNIEHLGRRDDREVIQILSGTYSFTATH